MRIAVTLFCKRFIEFEYAHYCYDLTYYLPTSSEFFQQLLFQTAAESSKTVQVFPNTEGDLDTIKRVRTSFVDIEVKDYLKGLIKPEVIGLRLHRFAKLEMCREIELMLSGQEASRGNIKMSLQFWLKQRSIEDEDFSIETAIKTFFRFRQEKQQKKTAKTAKSCALLVPSTRNILTPFLAAEMSEILRGYVSENEPYFLTTAKKPHRRRIKQCYCFILRKIGRVSLKNIEKKEKIPARTVQHNVRKFAIFLQSKPNLKPPMA